MSIKCYFLYGLKGTGKTLTAYLLSKKYNTIYEIPFQPFIKSKNSFNFKGYRGEEVILIDNDLYKGREYSIFLMLTNWYQVSPIKKCGYRRYGYEHERYEERWKSPKCIVLCSKEKPNNEILKILKETDSEIYEYKYNNLINILDDIKEKFPIIDKEIEIFRKEKVENINEKESETVSDVENENEKKPKKRNKKINKGNILDYIKMNIKGQTPN